jgi:site-specific recombinase XerD
LKAAPARAPDPPDTRSAAEWAAIASQAPEMATTMRRYLAQVATFLAPSSVLVADNVLRQLAKWLLANTTVRALGDVRRDHVEDFKLYLVTRRGMKGGLSTNTQRQRLRTLRVFFERLVEWDWPDAPGRNPVIGGDIPPRPEPLPKFLDDRDAAKLMAAARAAADPRDRLVVELLARTGMRCGELASLEADSVVLIGKAYWLRVPLGKLRNDRYVPLHPDLVKLLSTWTAANLEHIRHHKLLVADERGPLERFVIRRIVKRVGRSCGVDVHPHQLRHTLATQAINRGMRLEAIAALLGHRSMEMTLTYARIANRVVADEYQAISAQIDALYGQELKLPADYETRGMARLRREAHARMLGNGLCTRPVELECRMESACETCSYFQTNVEFKPTLVRQRDHAASHGQTERAALFESLIERVDRRRT